jgi:hypothetical protein
MDKDFATYVLGGSEAAAAGWLNISVPYYRELPERLHPVMTDRIYAAVLRKEMATAIGLTCKQFNASVSAKALLESLLVRVSIAACAVNLMNPVPPEFAGPGPEPGVPRKRPYVRREDKGGGTQMSTADASAG